MLKSHIKILGAMLLGIALLVSCKSTRDADDGSAAPPASTAEAPAISPSKAPKSLTSKTKTQDQTAKGESITLSEAAMAKGLPVDPSVRTGKLANGLRYYIRKNTKPENTAELRLAVNAGSILEEEDQQGLAHFVEHMAFNGTKNFPKNELISYLESIGTRFGAHLNAYTSFDETVYMLRVPTDSAQQFEQGFQILEDWAHNVTFEGEEIEKERGVVIEEWRLRLGADNRMQQKTLPATFYDSHYAQRLPIGKEPILKNFSHDRLTAFYEKWYRPDLMAVVAVGDFDVDEVEKMIKEKFGKIAKPKTEIDRPFYDVPDHIATQIAIATDPEATNSRVSLAYKHPKSSIENLKDYRDAMVSRLCNEMLNSRLDELTQQEDPPFSFAFSGYGSMARTKDQFSATAFVPTGGHAKALKTLLVENERAARHGFTPSELERAKRSLVNDLQRSVAEKDKTPSERLVWTYVRNFLNGSPMISPEDRLQLYQRQLPTIDLQTVNRRIQSWITEQNRVVTMQGPEKEEVEMPTEEEILNMLDQVDELQIEPYEDEVVREPLFGGRPKAGKIVKEEEKEVLGVTELTFANGIKVVLKPTDFQNDQISMTAFSPGGMSLVPDAAYWSGSMASQLISSSGLGPYDKKQLEKYMSDKTVQVSPYIGSLEEGFRGTSSVKDQEIMLQMVNLYFTAPRKDETAFKAMMSQQMSLYGNLLSRPEYYFLNERIKFMYGERLRGGFPTPENLEKVEFEEAYEIYRDRFADVSDFTFIFVGNIEMESFKELLAHYLGSIPAKNREESWKDVGMEIKEGKHIKTFNKGSEPKSAVEIMYHGGFEWNLGNRYELNTMAEVLKIMLREALREEKSGVYGVRTAASPTRYPKNRYQVNISFSCSPENTEELIKTAHREIKKLQKEGASKENLQKVKEIQRKELELGKTQNRFWMSRLQFLYENDLPLDTYENTTERIDKITTEDIRKAANRYLTQDNYLEFKLLPKEKQAD